MTGWANDELATIGAAEEVQIAPGRRDGTRRNPVTVWAVRHGDGVYVRSAVRGRNAAWFRAIPETHEGRIWAGNLEKDVAFADADLNINDEIDAAYRAKYRRYAGRILNSCLTAEARSTTIQIMPR